MSQTTLDTPLLASIAGPLAAPSRLQGLDLCRGLALLGITFVNVELFVEPFASIVDPSMPPGLGPVGQAFYWFNIVFCATKFYPLFSLLFGIGLAVILSSAMKAGRSFEWLFARRLVILAAFGLAHVALLWCGDILLLYAMVGVLMLLLARLSPRGLFIAAGVFFLIGILGTAGFSLLGVLTHDPNAAQAVPKAIPDGATPLEQWLKVMRDFTPDQTGYDPRMAALETVMLRDGPFAAALAVRAFNYLFSLVFMILIMGWQVAACFCFGAALLKSGFVHGQRPAWRRRFIALGLVIGLPLQILAAWASNFTDHPALVGLGMMCMQIGGPAVSLMYLSVALNFAESGKAPGVARAVANLGRCGLTGYLGISFLMQVMMSHWGLGWFGSVDYGPRWLLVLGTWAAMLLFANLWLRVFAIGPLEWLWRTLTYLKVQPLTR